MTNNATIASGCKWLCGSRLPDIYGSLSSSLHIKNVDISALFTYSLGGRKLWLHCTATTVINDRFLIDASYFTIKSVSAGYTFKSTGLEKYHIRSLRLYASGDNLLMFSALKGLNPQSSFTGSTSYTYTPNRTVSLGVDIKF